MAGEADADQNHREDSRDNRQRIGAGDNRVTTGEALAPRRADRSGVECIAVAVDVVGVGDRRVIDDRSDRIGPRIDQVIAPGVVVELFGIGQPVLRLEPLARRRIDRCLPPDVHASARGAGQQAGRNGSGSARKQEDQCCLLPPWPHVHRSGDLSADAPSDR